MYAPRGAWLRDTELLKQKLWAARGQALQSERGGITASVRPPASEAAMARKGGPCCSARTQEQAPTPHLVWRLAAGSQRQTKCWRRVLLHPGPSAVLVDYSEVRTKIYVRTREGRADTRPSHVRPACGKVKVPDGEGEETSLCPVSSGGEQVVIRARESDSLPPPAGNVLVPPRLLSSRGASASRSQAPAITIGLQGVWEGAPWLEAGSAAR